MIPCEASAPFNLDAAQYWRAGVTEAASVREANDGHYIFEEFGGIGFRWTNCPFNKRSWGL